MAIAHRPDTYDYYPTLLWVVMVVVTVVGQLTRSAEPEKLETVLDNVIKMACLPPQGPARRSLAGAEGTLVTL